MTRTLVFVYNRNSGFFSAATDYVQRTLGSDSYPCPLSAVTLGPFGMRSRWKRYIAKLETPKRFLSRDEFSREFAKRVSAGYPNGLSLPVVVLDEEDELTVLASAAELASCAEVDDLIDLLTSRLLPK